MDDFIFDLQRFVENPSVVSIAYGNNSLIASIDGTEKTVVAGDGTTHNISLFSSASEFDAESIITAAVSLTSENAHKHFFTNYYNANSNKVSLHYGVKSGDGINVSIGSESTASIGELDEGDVFYVNDKEFSFASFGIMGGSEEVILNSSASSVVLNGTSFDSTNSDLYKVLAVNNSSLTINSAKYFGLAGYAGVMGMDTTTGDAYARLYADDGNNPDVISLSSANTLSNLSLSSDVASLGAKISNATENLTVNAGGTEFNAKSSSFRIYGKTVDTLQVISLSSDATDMTLYDGNLIFAEGQSLNATNSSIEYTFYGYSDDSTNNDGIIVYTNSNGISTLGDIDVGESFVIASGASSTAYSMTGVGLVKSGSNTPLTYNNYRLSSGDLSFNAILKASAMSNYYDATKTAIRIGTNTDSSVNPSIIAYGTNALATLTLDSLGNYSLKTDSSHNALHLDKWTGVTIDSGKTLYLSPYFIGSTPLKIDAGTATIGVTNTSGKVARIIANDTITTVMGGGYTDISGIDLFSGSLRLNQNLNVKLANAGNVTIKNTAAATFPAVADDNGGATLPGGSYYYYVGRGYFDKPSNPVTIDKNGITTVVGSNFTLDGSKQYSQSTNTTTGKASSITFIYGKTTGISVSALDAGDVFKLTDTSDSLNSRYYTVTSDRKLVSAKDSKGSSDYRIWIKDEKSYDDDGIYDITDNKYFQGFMPAVNDKITINSDYSIMSADEDSNEHSRLIVESTSGGISSVEDAYGTFIRTSDGYSISDASKKTGMDLSSILITSNVFNDSIQTVSLASVFSGVDISIESGHNFKTRDDLDYAFSVKSLDDTLSAIHITGSESISLASGTVYADSSEQAIKVDNYTIYAGDNSNITIEKNGSNIYIGDIVSGESFSINGVKYTRSDYPLNFTDNEYFYDVAPISGRGTLSDDTNTEPVAIDISSFSSSNKQILIAPNTEGNLVIGNTPSSISGMLVDDTVSAPSYLFAKVQPEGNSKYLLDSISSATTTQTWNVNVISLVGGETSINSALFARKSPTITTNDTLATVTSFKVNDTSGYFYVNGSSNTPTVQNATDITLLDGNIYAASISATKNQTIKIGESALIPLQATSGTKIIYSSSDKQATVESSANTALTVGSGNASTLFNVKSGEMEFIVEDALGAVTITGLDDTTSDIFTYSGTTYSLKPAGLVSGTQLWNNKGVHTLEGASVAAADLTDEDNWINIASVKNDTATIPAALSTPLIFIDSDYKYTYGSLSGNDLAYTLSTSTNDSLNFSAVQMGNSESVTLLELPNNFLKKTIAAAGVVSLVPTALIDTAEPYQVTLSTDSNLGGLSNVSAVSLISGTLEADSLLGVSVYYNSNSSVKIQSTGDKITLLADNTDKTAYIELSKGESFSLSNKSYGYTLGRLGLTRTTGTSNAASITYLNAINEGVNSLSVDSIINGAWAGVIAPEDNVLTISGAIKNNAIIADDIKSPDYQYGNLNRVSAGNFSLETVDSTASDELKVEWPITNTILISEVTVTASSDFQYKKFKAASSSAIFAVSDSKDDTFTIMDKSNGASISGNTAISLNSGTINTADNTQTITAGSYQIIYGDSDSGNGINVIAAGASAPTIGALNATGDSFRIEQFDKTYTLMASKNRLRTSDNEILKNATIDSSVKVSDLQTADWYKLISVESGNLTVNSSPIEETILSGGGSAYVINGDSDNTIFGTLTKTNAGYSLTKDSNSTAHKLNSITLLKDGIVTLISDFANISMTAKNNSNNTSFKVTQTSGDFVLDYTGDYVEVENATALSLTSGTVKTATTNQTVQTGGYKIYGTSFATGSDNSILIINNSNNVSVSGLDVGDAFNYANKNHKVTAIGVVRANSLLADADWDETSGIFDVTNSNFSRELTSLTSNELDLSTSNKRKVYAIVDDIDNPTSIIGETSTISTGGLNVTSDIADSIKSIYLGNTPYTITSNFDTSVRTDSSSKLFVINGDSYQAANSALTIQSGTSADNNSALLYGAVQLNSSTYSAVKTSYNAVSVNSGDVTLTADENGDTVTGLNNGDIFSVGKGEAPYSVKGAGLLSANKIWSGNNYTSGVAIDSSESGLLNDDNWNYYIAVDESVLAIPPSSIVSGVTQWAILNDDMSKNLGMLTSLSGGYSVALTSWSENYTLSINDITASLPAVMNNNYIQASNAKALFKITDKNTAFTVTDDSEGNGATIGNATKISLTSGTIALPAKGQTVAANVSLTGGTSDVSVANGSESLGITFIVDGTSASIGALNIAEGQRDTFSVNGTQYQMLSNGSIQRQDGRFWRHSTVSENGAVDVGELLTDDNDHWVGSVSISSGNLTINSNVLGSLSAAYVFEQTNPSSIYGSLEKTSSGYNLDSLGSTVSLTSITIEENAKSVSLSAGQNEYLNVPIIAGTTATLVVTGTSNDTFSIGYDNNIWSSDATAISLSGGTWQLSDTNQTLTANDKVVQVGSATVSVTSDSNGVNVTGIEDNEVVSISGTRYAVSLGAISVSLNGSNTLVNGISSDDVFSIGSDKFIKRDAGFIKSNSKSYLWVDGDVTSGASLNALTGTSNDYWQQVATVANDNVTINATTPSAILIDGVEDLSKIYGSVTASGTNYTLSTDQKNTLPASIIIDGVKAQIACGYSNISISAAGASFIVTSLTSGSYSVDANTNSDSAILSNAAQVNLISGTLANLTDATTINVGNDTVIAAATSTINVGYADSVITVSGLNQNGEGFNINDTAYVYKNVGLVKDNSLLGFFETDSKLNGSVTSTALANETFQNMIASTGNVLTLQSEATDIVFVDSADNNVSTVYATQAYANNAYTIDTIRSGNYTIDAGAMGLNTSITADFKSKVLTPATGTFYVNGVGYTAVDSLSVETSADSSTLYNGKVLLEAGASVAITNISSVIAATSGEIHVDASIGSSYTLGELNSDDVFTIGDANYTMKSDNYLVRTKDGQNAICTTAVTDKQLTSTVINNNSNWKNFVTLDEEYRLNLDSTTSVTGSIVVSNDFADIYASITGSNNSFSLGTISGGASTASIKAINLSGASSTLSANFAATVKTEASNSTYRVNQNNYTAIENSELEIETSATDSSIVSGIISLSNVSPTNPVKTKEHTISGTVSKVDIANMSFTPGKNETFTVDDQTYTMNELEVGLTWGDDKVWTKSNVDSYQLPPSDSDWSNMLVLGTDGELNLANGAASSNIIIDNGRTMRLASLVAGDNEFTLNGINDNGTGVSSIVLGDAEDVLTLTADFVTEVNTGEGLYNINNVTYNGNGLKITTSKNSSALYSGTVSLSADNDFNTVSDSTNTYKVTNGDITATATDGIITTLGSLDKNDRFTIGNNYYKVLGNLTLIKTSSDGGDATQIYKDSINDDNTLEVSNIVDTNFIKFVELGDDGVLNLVTKLSASSAIVLDYDDDDNPIRVAHLTYSDDDGYKLSTEDSDDLTNLNGVKLGAAVKTFYTTSEIDTTVNTTAKGTYTINNKSFIAQGNLEIAASGGNEAKLVNGAVTLNETVDEVATSQTDEIIKATNGSTITVTADDDEGTITISGLNAGETFTFGGVSYTMTPIGLLYESTGGSLLNPNVVTDGNSVVTTNLDVTNKELWLTLLQASGGALTLTSSTPSNVVVVDMTSSTQAVKYGTLTKSGNLYTLEQEDGDTQLNSISMTRVKATFGAMAGEVPITTNNSTTFSVTTTGNFTIDATSTNPTITDDSEDNLLTGVVLSAGTIQAPINIPVTAGSHEITATSGTMTISYTDSVASISGLDSEETFTADGKAYKVMTVGKLFDVTDASKPLEVTAGFASKTFTPDNLEATAVLAVNNNALDISAQTSDAYVYDSLTNPTIKYAELAVTEGRNKTLTAESDEALIIQTVSVAANDILTIDFATQVQSPKGKVTVNTKSYSGTSDTIKIATDGTTTNSTLYEGTIELNGLSAYTSASDSNGNTLTRNSGTFTATAASGKFTTLTGLDNAESFTYGDATYTQNIPGLINTTSSEICQDILAGATINLADLSGATWNKFAAPVDGVLDISNLSDTTIIYDNTTTPTTKLATLTVTDGVKTLTGEENAANSILEVVIAAGDNLSVNFATQIDSAVGTVTVNGNTYAGTTELLIDSDGKTSTLYDGTITLDETNSSASDSSKNTLARESGTFTATASEGAFTTIKGLNNTESFTYGGKTYVQSAQGLRNGSVICRDLKGTTIDLSKLDGTWDNILAPTDGVLDISNFSSNAYVYNSATNPTRQLAILTTANGVKTLTNSNNAAGSISTVNIAAGDNLSVDFATKATAPVGTVTVNDKNYVGTTELVITSDGTTSTLTDGTVTLAATAEVTTTGGAAITCAAGDGITIAVASGDGETVTFSGLNEGDEFTIGENSYKVNAVAPTNSDNELWNGSDFKEGITLAAINTADNWKPMLAVSDGALSVDGETLTDGGEVILVDSVSEPTKVYGYLSKTDGKYILTKPTTATNDLTTLNASGVAIEIASDYAGIDLVANESAISGVTLTDDATSYTLDATSTTPSLSNVQALTLTAGTITGAVNQAVTTGNNVITPTAINGALTIGTTKISGIDEGDAFTLNDKSYVMLNTGLFNDTDNKLVTSGLDDGTLTLADIGETQLIAIRSGTLNLSNAAAGDSLVVDTVESPANIYGKLTKNGNTYTLNKQSDGITSITMPDANSTLTTDIAATVTTPSGSKSFTINGKTYTAKESALTIASDGATSTLTTGTISLANANATVTTTSGTTITYTADNDGLTVAVNGGITFSDLTAGDTFTIGENNYKVSAVGLINLSGEFWTGSDYSEGITLAAINNADNWTAMLEVNDAALSIDSEILEDGGEVILVDSLTEPTAVYGDLSKTDGKYTLTKPTAATTNLSTLGASGVAIEIASDYAGIDLLANDSAFSDVTLTDGATSYTLDATNTTPNLSNVQSLTLTAGTITGAVNQVVTTGNNVITPTTINGALTIGTTTLSGITTGDAFTLNDKAYVMLNTGLFNDTDNKLVTSGLDDGTLTLNSIVETQLIAIRSGTLNLSNAAAGDSLVVDTVESPAHIYGKLTKNSNTYTLTKQSDGITSITMPDANSTLTTDIAATVTTPTGSNTFTINGKAYTAKESALTIASDGTTSTLTSGTISLATENATVTTTSGTTITYTTDNDGLTVAVNGGITLSDLTAGDTFTIGENAYRVTQLGFHDDNNYLWTGADYTSGVTLDAINNSDNWTRTVTATNDSLTVDDTTLTDGTTAIVIDSSTAATKTLGTLSRSGNAYTLTKGDSEKLSGITIDNTTLAIDNQLADVPVTAKGATFTVTAATPYTVDATGNITSISDEATAIEISTGTIAATTNQTVTATSDSGETNIIGQNNGTFNIGGEAFTVADNSGSVTFSMTNGVPNKVSDLEANANVTIDGRTYTAPQDNSTLTYSDENGWYFDGYVPTKYNITIDGDGNILVDAGVKFTDVISSGRTLPEDNTIKLAADVNSIAVNVTNNGSTAIAINDKDGNELVNNLGTVADVTFDSAGVMVENTSDVAGAVFTIDNGQSFETETATIKASADDCAVGIGSGGTSLSVDKAATVDAPNNTALTLGNAAYTVNGVDFTTSGTTQASITSAGVKLDLATSDAITYNNSGYDGTGSAKADISKAGGVSLTSGASVNSAAGKTFNITGTVTLDANTIDAASATDITTKASGYAVGNDDVTISGDNDGYKVNIADGKISGLENIGNAEGVTIGGLSNGTIKTDKAGAFTVGDRTFVAIGDASVTYGIENGTLATADEVDSVISGDFAEGLSVNGGKLQVTGDNVSLDASTDNDRKVGGFNDKATLTTADNVVKIEPTGAGEFTFGDHIFKTDDATIAFNLNNSSVTGVDSLENGNLIISQDETNFGVNDESIDLAEIDAPVTLEIADSKIQSVYGLHSGMDGIDNATVYGLSAATVNGVYFEVAGGSVDVVVVDGVPVSLYGLESDMTVNSAPSIAARTTENGTFQFVDDIYHINDTLDGIVVFDTDGDTHVINIGEFEGSVSGDLKDLSLNDKPFNSSSDKVTVANDGADILKLGGLSSGDSISGSLSKASYVMPEGTLNVNDRGYILSGDDNGVSMTGDGMEVVGLDIDASLTVAKGGAYSVNGQSFDAKDGDTFIAGRDGVYIADPNNKTITEKTKIDDIIQNLLGKQEDGTVSLSGDSAASVIASGNLDSPMALTLDNSNGTGTQTADFSNSQYSKRVTLLGGDQDVKFNDEGRNAAYITPTSRGKKNIELGDGGDVAVNDSPYAKVSIKAGAGSDTIVNRNGASSTVDVKKNGDTTIVPTSGKVTLQNYDNDNNAKIRTFEYKDLGNAIKSNEIKFGNGVMTLGDAVVVFDPNASAVGGTFANLVDYSGDTQRVGFTHKAGGVLNASTSADDLILKGNYAENSSDTQKSGSSTLISGGGNDTILAGGGDYINAGADENQIYITDSSLNDAGATIVLAAKSKNTVHNFKDGYDTGDAILVSDLSALDFTFGDEGLVMRSGKAQITFEGLEPAEDLITYSDDITAAPYEIKLTDGKATYNAAVAQEDKDIGIGDDSDANIFYGNKKGSGLNFSEYSGAVEVNLNSGAGSVNGTAAQFYNINKVAAGSGDSSLIGKAGAKNTLIAGTGNTSIWSNAGRDLMSGNTSEDKNGSTMFYYLAGDGRDTITNFNFATSANDNSDIINITAANAVTNVYLRGDNVVMQINNSDSDYLTLVDAKGKDFKINNLIAKVDVNADFDNVANCYVADSNNATMNVGAGLGDAQVWLDDRITGQHGVYYLGEIKYLDARTANGNSTLVGNDLDNIIYGGEGQNSIWGGFGANNDTLIGGIGHNVFFFGMQNGNDIIQGAKAGDVIDLTTISLEQVASTTVNGGGAKLELTDGSSLEIQGTADVEYRFSDGSRYKADHSSGQWKSNS